MNLFAAIAGADDAVLRWLNSFMGQAPLFDKLVHVLLTADLFKFGALMAVYCGLWFRDDPRRDRHRRNLVVGIMAGTIGMFAARFLTLALPFRDRPFMRPDLGFVLPPYYQPEFRTWSAFPSDHAALAFALCTGIWLISRRFGLLAYLYAFVMICLPRIYFGLHHPSDVIAGALVGIASVRLCCLPRLLRPVTTLVMKLEARHAGAFYSLSFVVVYQITILFGGLRSFAESAFKMLHLMIG